MTTYRWSNNGWLDKATGEPMALPQDYVPSLPMVISDIEPYESPASGRIITSRSEQRYDLESTGCRLVDPSESPTKGKLRNKKFAEKRGLMHMLDPHSRDYDSSTKAAAE